MAARRAQPTAILARCAVAAALAVARDAEFFPSRVQQHISASRSTRQPRAWHSGSQCRELEEHLARLGASSCSASRTSAIPIPAPPAPRNTWKSENPTYYISLEE